MTRMMPVAKRDPTNKFPKNLEDIAKLQNLVADLYKQLYWNRFWGDGLPDQAIAEKLFDISVNLGVKRAVVYLQEALNLLNRNQENYKDIVMDGLFGRKTVDALKTHLAKDKPVHLLKIMSILQGMHYIDYMRRSSVQEKYARGWLKRV